MGRIFHWHTIPSSYSCYLIVSHWMFCVLVLGSGQFYNQSSGPDYKYSVFEEQTTQQSARMIFAAGLACFLLALTAEARVGNSSELTFCSETEQCLLFDLICETAEYEVRHYDSVKWVSTHEKAFFMEMAVPAAFNRLYEYITGDNDMGEIIQMTSPVLLKMPDKRFWEMGIYKMSFLLPAEYQKSPPNPTNPEVYIDHTPDMNVYVHSYGGWLMTYSDSKKAEALSNALDSVKAEYQKGFHYGAGYNSPMTMFNRHNEVWFVAEDEPVCGENSSEETD